MPYPQAIRPEQIPAEQRPKSKGAWTFLTDAWDLGHFTVLRSKDGSFAAQFHYEGEDFIPFAQMGYNSELGLYDKRSFPEVADGE